MNPETMVHGQYDWCLYKSAVIAHAQTCIPHNTIKTTILLTHKFQKRDSGGS